MARTHRDTPKKTAWLARLDRIGARLVRRSARENVEDPRRILVVELWHLGDVVLATAILARLRERYPRAKLTLLAKNHAEILLRHSGLVDEFVTFDFPWTAFREKYRLSRYSPLALFRLFRDLRRKQFDVAIDCRMDLRSNLVTALSGARRRIGYDFGGGSFLLTDAVPAEPDKAHKVRDWLRLLEPLGMETSSGAPRLTVSAEERIAAERRLRAMGLLTRPLVVIHPGARQEVRRWGLEKFARVAGHAARTHRADVMVILDETGYGRALDTGERIGYFEGSLREMMAVLQLADLLIANDSGPMHIAAALGTPVLAIFGPQRREWYGPFGAGHRTVAIDPMPCRPCFDSCIFAEPVCLTTLSADEVIAELDSHFENAVERAVAFDSAPGEIRGFAGQSGRPQPNFGEHL
jgi:heptosyltransferase-2